MTITDALAFEHYLAQRQKDPLSSFRYISEAQRKLVEWLPKAEVLFRSGNGGGKTWVGAAAAVAMLRGKKDLAGVPLPELPVPCVGWALAQTYKSQVDSSQKAVLHWVGDWPHKLVYVAGEGKGYVETLWIATDLCKHGMDEKCKTCSRLVFHCAESQSGVGGRVDFVWADEPPLWETWDEFRQRGGAKRRLVRYITATPKDKRWWYWMAESRTGFVGCEDRIHNGLVEVRSSIYDNKALTPDALADKVAMANRSLLKKAIIYGDYVDLAGDCPFDIPSLEKWMKRARKPDVQVIEAWGERHSREGGIEKGRIRCEVEIYHAEQPDEHYVCVMDPAMFMLVRGQVVAKDADGAFQKNRDQCCMHILSRRKPRLCVRFIGYSGGYGLGSMALELLKRYKPVIADVDVTGGYGQSTIRALTEGGFYRFNREAHADNFGSPSSGLGFKINAINRAEIIGAIQQALIEDSLLVESEEVIRSLMSISVSRTPKGLEHPEAAGPGSQDHDMICLGRALHLMETLPALRPEASPGDKLLRAIGVPWGPRASRAPVKIRWGPY